jgi:hypothetical protein
MTDIIAISANGEEYKLQPLKTLISFMVTVSLSPIGVPVQIIAHCNGRDYNVPFLFYHWAKTISTLTKLVKETNRYDISTGRIELIKALRTELKIGLFEAKQLGTLMIDKQCDLNDGPEVVRICSYSEETMTFPEIEAMTKESDQ